MASGTQEPLLNTDANDDRAVNTAKGGSSSSSSSSRSDLGAKIAKLVGALLLGAVLVYMCVCHGKDVKAWVLSAWENLKGLGYAACPVIAFICWVMTTLAGPVFLIEVSAGALFQQMFGMQTGALLAMASCGCGVWLGCITAFVLGQSFLKPKVKEIIESHEVLSTVNQIIKEEGWKFAFLMRLNPLIPFELFNYAVAMTDISGCHNAIAAIGTMPIVMFEVYSAASAAELAQSMGGSDTGEDQNNKIKATLIKLAVSGVLILAVCVYGKRKYDAKVSERDAKVDPSSPNRSSSLSSFSPKEFHRAGTGIRNSMVQSVRSEGP